MSPAGLFHQFETKRESRRYVNECLHRLMSFFSDICVVAGDVAASQVRAAWRPQQRPGACSRAST
ncbi:protein of unknown function [Rhodovastum atsumiense]|nr:protein of unknown function [Rhodovastum atsumiense]